MGKLVLFLQDGSTLPIPLDKERIVIGRRADNDVCLPHPAVSGEHAQVVTILADSFLEDLGSTNGTLVNGKAVAKHFLRDRDQIDIGRQRLVYLADDAAHVEPPPSTTAAARTEMRTIGERVPLARSQPSPKRKGTSRAAAKMADVDLPPVEPAPAVSAEAQIDTALIPEPAPLPEAVPEAAPAAVLHVLSGANTGRELVLERDETALGRVGLQVARIRKSGTVFRLEPVEGDAPPQVNGQPIGAEGVELQHGDELDVAGARIRFVVPPR